MWLSINYDLLRSWKPVVLTTVLIQLAYQAMIYLHPANTGWISSEYFSWKNLLQFVFIDQILIECITVGIIFQLIRWYGLRLKLTEVRLNLKELILYEIKFVPLFLTAFFIFAPFTLTTRFIYHYVPNLSWDIYFEEYFYSTQLYINYLTPVLILGFFILNVNLIILYNRQLGKTSADLNEARKPKLKDRIWASDDWGEVFLEVEKIVAIVREDRKSLAVSGDTKYRLKGTITELEEKLDPDQFIRVNRSTIVNLEYVLNYSFWENDKYVLRMNDDSKSEYVMSRDRLQKIKHLFLESA